MLLTDLLTIERIRIPLHATTKDDVLRVAKQYLHPNRYALVVVGNLAKAKVNQ